MAKSDLALPVRELFPTPRFYANAVVGYTRDESTVTITFGRNSTVFTEAGVGASKPQQILEIAGRVIISHSVAAELLRGLSNVVNTPKPPTRSAH